MDIEIIITSEGHMDKAKGRRFEGGRRGWVGQEGIVGGKWRQLYLNNNKKLFKKKKRKI